MTRRRSIFITAMTMLCLGVALHAKSKDDKKKDEPRDPAVEIKDLKFKPDKLKIKTGQTVVWTNNDDKDHTVIADDESFKSENISPGKTFKHTFKEAGKFGYSCSYHPRMKGIITVSD